MSFHPEQLGAFPWATVRLYCKDCHRFAQFQRARLIERFGGEIHGHTLLNRLAPCDRVGKAGSVGFTPCQLVYFDLMSPERRAEALARGGLPKGWTAG
jgi:hypothetical protein